MRADRDTPWKEVLERYLREFLAFFFPAVGADIDWGRKPEFLDKELQKVVRAAALGRQIADALAKVWLRNGGQVWLLIHIEVQDRPRRSFPHDMYVYNYRIHDRYHREVVSLAVLTGKRVWVPGPYEERRWGFEHVFRFPVATLDRFRMDPGLLEDDPNPFSLVVLAHLDSQQALDDSGRYVAKVRLIRLLYGRGYGRKDIMELLRFIDWLLVLPEDLERRLAARTAEFDRRKVMPYVTSWERIGRKDGLKDGLKEGLKEGLKKGRTEEVREGIRVGLRAKFGRKGLILLPRIERIGDLDRLRKIREALFTAESLDQIAALLRNGRR